MLYVAYIKSNVVPSRKRVHGQLPCHKIDMTVPKYRPSAGNCSHGHIAFHIGYMEVERVVLVSGSPDQERNYTHNNTWTFQASNRTLSAPCAI